MDTAMLSDDRPAVDTDDFTVRESTTNDAHRLLIVFGLSVSGHEYSTVQNQVVGISSRKLFAVFDDRIWKGQPQQTTIRKDSCQRINMSVCIITWQRLIVEPDNPFCKEIFL